jgi:hypothetical protein
MIYGACGGKFPLVNFIQTGFRNMKSRKAKIILWAGGAVAALLVLAGISGAYYFHRHIPAEIIPDIRAAIAARNEPDPDVRFHKYLEGLYGSLEDPAHREKAFEDFFNPNHIKAMQILVKHSPPNQRQANIQATSRWVSSYRQTMSSQEKNDLGDYFQSGAGRSSLQAATALFMSQDAVYRANTVPVVTELMTTLQAVRK